MDRCRAYLVITVLAALFAASCLEVDTLAPKLPRPIYIEAAFSDDEVAIIEASIAEWNTLSLEYLGVPALEYLGRYDDPDGFQPEDLLDGPGVVYRESVDGESYDFLQSQEKFADYPLIGGYATPGDVLIFVENISTDEMFRHVALHELGHHLGLQHIKDDQEAVMYLGGVSRHLNNSDREAFCIVHDCHCD